MPKIEGATNMVNLLSGFTYFLVAKLGSVSGNVGVMCTDHGLGNGETGYALVDAGMKQLNMTGWMHNRVRMIVAMFLTKDLLIDWRWGEKYFASKLIDYDPASNNGGWQWSASTGTDSQPYFRIFNPWSQSKEYDKDCEYIKKWVPELKDVPPKDIHKWDNPKVRAKYPNINYPEPIVNQKEASRRTLEEFKKAAKK